MSELKKIYFINTCIPHIVRDSIFIGEFPVDSDVFVNFNRAFNDLDYVGINIFYTFGNGTILIDELKSIQAIDENLNHDDIIIVFNSINENINEGNNEAISHNISNYIKNKYKNSIVLTFIPDAHPNNLNLQKIVETFYTISDKIITPYIDTENIFKMIYKADKFVDKFYYIKNIPTIFNGDKIINSVFDKIYDITFLGTSRSNRTNAMKILLNIDFLNFKFDNTGRKFTQSNQLRYYDDFTRILNYSKFSLCTPSTSFIKIAKLHEFNIFSRPVFPGRVAECIAAGCIPLYMTEHDEIIPLESIDENFPVLLTNLKNLENDFKTALHNYDFEKTIANLKQYHETYLSSRAILKPLLDQITGHIK